MHARQAGTALRRLCNLVSAGPASPASDRALLERVAGERDGAAFETLIRRHGPMVLRVCRRVLFDGHEAEDAFQATFLVLFRKAGSAGRSGLLTSWLYGVAYRVAARARANAARCRRARATNEVLLTDPLAELSSRELVLALEEELNRLPERYRAPLVLCYLEGQTRDEAARQLDWSLGTLKRRLQQARDLLHARLIRRGVELPAALLAVSVVAGAQAELPAPLVTAACQAALSSPSSATAALAAEVTHAMFVSKSKKAAVVALALLGIVAVGVGLSVPTPAAGDPPQANPPAAAPPSPAANAGGDARPAAAANKEKVPPLDLTEADDEKTVTVQAGQEITVRLEKPRLRKGDPLKLAPGWPPRRAVLGKGLLDLEVDAATRQRLQGKLTPSTVLFRLGAIEPGSHEVRIEVWDDTFVRKREFYVEVQVRPAPAAAAPAKPPVPPVGPAVKNDRDRLAGTYWLNKNAVNTWEVWYFKENGSLEKLHTNSKSFYRWRVDPDAKPPRFTVLDGGSAPGDEKRVMMNSLYRFQGEDTLQIYSTGWSLPAPTAFPAKADLWLWTLQRINGVVQWPPPQEVRDAELKQRVESWNVSQDEGLRWLTNKARLVIWGTVVSEPEFKNSDAGFGAYHFAMEISEVLRGELKGKTVRVVYGDFDLPHKPLPHLKRGADLVLFTGGANNAEPPVAWTVDRWFGAMPYSPGLVRAITSRAKGKQ